MALRLRKNIFMPIRTFATAAEGSAEGAHEGNLVISLRRSYVTACCHLQLLVFVVFAILRGCNCNCQLLIFGNM